MGGWKTLFGEVVKVYDEESEIVGSFWFEVEHERERGAVCIERSINEEDYSYPWLDRLPAYRVFEWADGRTDGELIRHAIKLADEFKADLQAQYDAYANPYDSDPEAAAYDEQQAAAFAANPSAFLDPDNPDPELMEVIRERESVPTFEVGERVRLLAPSGATYGGTVWVIDPHYYIVEYTDGMGIDMVRISPNTLQELSPSTGVPLRMYKTNAPIPLSDLTLGG